MKHRLAVSAIVAGLTLAWSLALAPGSATSASADSNPGPTTITFDGTQSSLPLTDFSGRYIMATLRDKNGKALGGDSNCSNYGPVFFTFTNETTHTVRTVKACLDAQAKAGAKTPSSCYKAAIGIQCSVSARFQTNGDTFASSATTKPLILKVAPTPVVAFSSVDYDKSSPTKATVYGGLESAVALGGEDGGYYDTVPTTGTWKLAMVASDGSTPATLTRMALPAGVSPQWSATGLIPGTQYTAVASYTYSASDVGRHKLSAPKPSKFTTAGTAPPAVPTDTPTPTSPAQPTVQPTSTPDPQVTANAGKSDSDTAAGSIVSALGPVFGVLAGVIALAIIGVVIGMIVYRRRHA